MTTIRIGTEELIVFVLVDSDGVEVAGLDDTFDVEISKNGGAFAAGVGDKAEIGSGWYSYELTEDETDTIGPLAVVITGVGAVQQNLLYEVVGYIVDPLTGTDVYCGLDELKTKLDITDEVDDTQLEQIIYAVSRQIDEETKRRFYTTAAVEARYYTPTDPITVHVDDLLSVTSLEVDSFGNRTYSETWVEDDDFELRPYNAEVDGKPYMWLQAIPSGYMAFPMSRRSVKITGFFGYCAIDDLPPQIREACLLQCERLFKRKDAPFGVAGTPETGMMRLQNKLDPDVQRLLAPFKKVSL